MLEDDRTIRTHAQVIEEISWILDHDKSHFRSFAQVLRTYRPAGPIAVSTVLTLASDDVERFLFDLRRAISAWACLSDSPRPVAPRWD